jgi:hypothetical protein
MTFQVTVTSGGLPVQLAIVVANDEISGNSFSRGTDGGGYADVDVKATPIGTPMTLYISAPGFQNYIAYPVTTLTNQVISASLTPFKQPFKTAPRFWKANMCGIRIPGLPPVDGGATNPALFLSWFYDRYDSETRATIRAAMRGRGDTHWLLSWPDSRAVGATPQSFKALCQELIDAGFFPCVMLSSKDHDPPDVPAIMGGLSHVLPALVGVVPMFSVGWELSLWLSPTQVQQLTEAIAPICQRQAGTLLYVHFQQGYMSFPEPDHDNASYWNKQIGKLTGVLAQKRIDDDDAQFLDWIHDCLLRFAGGFNMPTGFDYVMLEISAMTQFNGTCSEAEGDRLGRLAIDAPAVNGISVQGSGNGS